MYKLNSLLGSDNMTFKPRFGTTVSQYVTRHDGNFKNRKRNIKHVRVTPVRYKAKKDTALTQAETRGVDDNNDDIAFIDRSRSPSSSESFSDSDREDDEDEWYDVENNWAEEDIQQLLDGMRLEEPTEEAAAEEPARSNVPQWADKTTIKQQRDDSFHERQNWLQQIPGMIDVMVKYGFQMDYKCKEKDCDNDGLWNCLDCDHGTYLKETYSFI